MSIQKIAERPLSAYETTQGYSSSGSIQRETMMFPARMQQYPTIYQQRPISAPLSNSMVDQNQQKSLGASQWQKNPDPTGLRQVLRERLKNWFTQLPIKPILQVKQRRRMSKDQANLASNKYNIYPRDTPIQNLIDKQIIHIEPSPQQSIIYNLTNQRGAVFQDNLFPPDQISLCGQKLYIPKWRYIVWKPATHINPSADIFTDDISPTDIKQGMLGDCYFLAALAALAEIPTRIYDLFLQPYKNDIKYYICKMMYKGKWKAIYLDDYIPTYANRPAFSGYSGNDMWVTLLEKAWAKLYSSYRRISAGYPEEGLHDLTGAHIQQWRFRKSSFNLAEFWKYMLKATELGYAMVASSLPGSDQNISTTGIVFGHAYTVLGAYEVSLINGAKYKIVLCRNPWGDTDSTMRWNDRDPVWNYVSQQQKDRIGFTPLEDDGLFFVSLKDFIENFTILTSAQVNDQASYLYLTQDARDNKGKFFKVQIYREGQYSFQVNQIPDRRYPQDYMDQYQYVQATLNIGKLESYYLKYIEGTQSAFRTLFKKCILQPGTYIVYAQINFDSGWQTDYQITLGIYADYPCNISVANSNQTRNFFNARFYDSAIQNEPVQIAPNLLFKQQIQDDGFIYVVIHNNSNREYEVGLRILQNRNPTVKIMPPNNNKSFIRKKIAPMMLFVVLARIGSYDYETTAICQVQQVR